MRSVSIFVLFTLSMVTVAVADPPSSALTPEARAAMAKKATEPQKPDVPKTLTIEEGQALYRLGVTEGMARAAVQSAQGEAKSALEKIAPQGK